MNRRHFLLSGTAAALAGPVMSLLAQKQATAQVSADYKALVCIYLFGGNDGYNTLVPYESAAYSNYLSLRPLYSSANKTGLGIDRSLLLPLAQSGEASALALHPSLSKTYQRWSQGKVAILQNIGNLVEPLTRSTYKYKLRPVGLGAHDEQQRISMIALQDPAGVGSDLGWGGRLWDRLASARGMSNNDWAQVSFAGQNRWQEAASQGLAALEPNAQLALDFQDHMMPLISDGLQSPRPFARAFASSQASAYSQGAMINAVFSSTGSMASTAFSAAAPGKTTGLYGQLLSVARFIEARIQMGAPGRQMFFVSLGGFDTHDTQYQGHANQLAVLDGALNAFMSTVEALGMSQQVTTFTMSDFGRTLRMNASNGTDHAWSSHSFVAGGAVKGGLYGRQANLSTNSEDIAPYSSNVVIPSLSVNQCGATLAAWMGLNESDLALVFPDLKNFATRNLGFMNV